MVSARGVYAMPQNKKGPNGGVPHSHTHILKASGAEQSRKHAQVAGMWPAWRSEHMSSGAAIVRRQIERETEGERESARVPQSYRVTACHSHTECS